jgi:dihydroxy-acid dehydratase
MVVPAVEASHVPNKDDTVPEDYDISKPIESNSGLRKGLTSYGDAHFSLFLRKVFIKALGYSEDALSRPIIGVINTYSSFSPCHGTVPQLVEAVKRGVQLHGGLCIDFPTISLHESFASPTSMFLRNLMSMDTEEMIRAQPVDACIMIGGAFCHGLLNWCGNVLNAQQVVTRLSLPNSWVDSHPTSLSCH